MLVTLLVSHPLIFSVVRPEQPLNMAIMLVTLLVSHPLIFRVARPEQPLNMVLMLVTLLVSKFSQPIIIASLQSENIAYILVNPEVSRCDTSAYAKGTYPLDWTDPTCN